MRKFVVIATAVLLCAGVAAADTDPIRSLDGSGNNTAHPDWGAAGTPYVRVAQTNYADGIARPVDGPNARYVSNRIFNDAGQNLFSENGVSQWVWTWGQFLDHTFGLRDETPAEGAPIGFDAGDPLEAFRNDLGAIDFSRTPGAPGTGSSSPREQINTIGSFIDASNVYGDTKARLDWLRDGSLDDNPANNSAKLLLSRSGYLPRVGARDNAGASPPMDLMGHLLAHPDEAVVAGDVRANENIALTSVHTLFAREHNRIVAALPDSLSDEAKFQIARRVVGAEEQFITYNEFLPSVGVQLPAYHGYDPGVNAGLSNEFAVVGYRAHSMIHGEFEPTVQATTYSDAQLAAFQAQGITVEREGDQVTLVIPLNVAFGNPELLRQVGLGPFLQGLGAEAQYRNDEQIDNALRSVLFQIPKPGVADPAACAEPVVNPDCFTGVADLGAIDVERGRDHGMPSYNDMRKAYGLAPNSSFTQITGEPTDRFPKDPEIDKKNEIDDPDILDFVELRDRAGNVIPLDSDEAHEDAVSGTRRTTLAARLRAVYGNVRNVDAFVGMVSEAHVPGTEFGELQLAIWTRQFEALRDGDRFFYVNDPALQVIASQLGIDYRHTLADIIRLNSDAVVPDDVFRVSG